MNKFNKKKYKILHPSGNIYNQLKTVEDLMISNNDIPFINQQSNMKKALNVISKKKLGILVAVNNKKFTTGIITDGQIRRSNQIRGNVSNLKVKDIMTKNPVSINKDTLAAKGLAIMSEKKITSLCVHNKSNKRKTVGILHIHHILSANIQ